MTPAPGTTIRCVGGLVYDQDGRLLLIRRRNEPGAGRWSLPGGKVEPGETDAEAVTRELREETGLDVIPGTRVGSVTHDPFEIHDYHCTMTGGILTPGDDATDARWSDRAELDALETSGALVDLLFITLRDWDALPC